MGQSLPIAIGEFARALEEAAIDEEALAGGFD